MQMQETQDISGKRIICSGEQDHLSHITWWSGCEKLGEGGDSNEFYLWGSQQNASTSEVEKIYEILQTVFKFQTGWKRRRAIISFKAIIVVDLLRKDLLLSCLFKCLFKFFLVEACRFSFSMCVCVCVLTFFCVGGWLKSADKLKRKMLSNEHSLESCRLISKLSHKFPFL